MTSANYFEGRNTICSSRQLAEKTLGREEEVNHPCDDNMQKHKHEGFRELQRLNNFLSSL
jgi:hypothetical protein